MAKVSLNINGRKYALGCDDGEEERLMRLGQKLDAVSYTHLTLPTNREV